MTDTPKNGAPSAGILGAREELPDPSLATTTSARVQFIMTVMALGLWSRHFCRQLAATWGISARTVRSHSAEAHRRLSEDEGPMDKAEARRDLTDRLMAWAAMDAQAGDRRTANKHLELVARINGLLVSQHQHQFEQEVREMLEIAKRVLPRDLFRKFLAALVAAGKGDAVTGEDTL